MLFRQIKYIQAILVADHLYSDYALLQHVL